MQASVAGFLRSRVIWVTLFCCLLYYTLGVWMPRQEWLASVRILQATMAIIVVVGFARAVYEAFKAPIPDRLDVMTIGIGVGQFSLFATGLWLLLYRLSGFEGARADWMLDTLLFGFLSAWLSSLSSLLHVTAPGVLRRAHGTEEIPPLRLITVGCVAGLGVMATLIVLATQPNVAGIVEAIRPYVK